ncbi:MAG: NADH-quinone oxidoreductase subunit N [Gemmataceae bacterium]|nr:NADH-quinone oxidoreductase subunit N [Gemmataceae bacterium]
MDASIATLQSAFRQGAPEAVLILTAFVVFLGGAFRPGKLVWGFVCLLGFVGALLVVLWHPFDLSKCVPTVSVLWTDPLCHYTRIVAIVGGVVLLLASWDELPHTQAADYFACLLILTAGVGLVGAANELVTMFLALELISIPTYVMLYLPRTGRPAQEAAVKYFLLSIFSSALLLFGFSYLYGVTGTTNIAAIHEAFARREVTMLPGLVMAGSLFVVAGLGFRITAVPFHFYAPDVYQGTGNGPAALLAFIPKVAGFVAFIRLLGFTGPGPVLSAIEVGVEMPLLLWILAAITMTIGNVLAVWQDDVKRMLAYSGVAHSGYMLLGLAVNPYLADKANGGVPAILFYLIAYGAMTVGAFAVLQALSTDNRAVSRNDDLAGLAETHPGLAMALALFLFSMIGLPLTAGFAGKFQLFVGVLSTTAPAESQMFRWLALIAAVNAAIGAFYYLRLIGIMYLRTAIRPLPGRAGLTGVLALAACVGFTVWLGVYPAAVVKFTRNAGQAAYPVHHLAGRP